MLKEFWKDVPGYEGLYEISNFGRVKSLPKKCGRSNRKQKILTPSINTYGYYQLVLNKGCVKKNFTLHRLVAQAFILNPNSKKTVNHINGVKLDNRIENLEWCSIEENLTHGWKTGLISSNLKGRFGKNNHLSKKINQYDKQGNFIQTWDSMRDIKRTLGIEPTNIYSCCKGVYKTSGGFKWNYLITLQIGG